jgi:hypothetical protein
MAETLELTAPNGTKYSQPTGTTHSRALSHKVLMMPSRSLHQQ